jgi:hypothetical protein
MAINYLEMNDAPEKFRYFDRFIDKDKYKELRVKHISGKDKEEKMLDKMKEIHSELIKKKLSKKSLKKAAI